LSKKDNSGKIIVRLMTSKRSVAQDQSKKGNYVMAWSKL